MPAWPGDVFDLAGRVEELLADRRGARASGSRSGCSACRCSVFAHYRGWYEELRRELRLLALNHGERLPGRHASCPS